MKKNKDIEKYKYIFEQQKTWIVRADTKISIAMGFFTIIFTIFSSKIFNSINYVFSAINIKNILSLLPVIVLISCLISFVFSIFFYIFTLIPRFDGKYTKENKGNQFKSIIYFEDIRRFKNSNEYIEYTLSVNDEDYNKQILSEIYNNAKICSKKMRMLTIALIFSFIMLASEIIYIILLEFI